MGKRRPTMISITTSYKECLVDISKNEFLEITYGFMKFIAAKILTGERVALPANMGSIDIIGRKPSIKIEDGIIKGLAPDWKSTLTLWKNDPKAKEEKKILYHFNDHTRGIRYKFSWITSRISATNKSLFNFIANRENKRKLWKSILSGKEFT